MTDHDPSESPSGERRVIKRYSNRKLYDTKGSTYVTLLQIAEMIRAGEDVQIVDNATKEDKTDVTLALIISEELRARPRAIPLATLKALIRQRGEKLLSQLRDGAIGKLMPGHQPDTEHASATPQTGSQPPSPSFPPSSPPSPSSPPFSSIPAPSVPPMSRDDDTSPTKENKGLRATLEQWQTAIDERIRAVLPNFSVIRELEQEVRRISERLDAIERRLDEQKKP